MNDKLPSVLQKIILEYAEYQPPCTDLSSIAWEVGMFKFGFITKYHALDIALLFILTPSVMTTCYIYPSANDSVLRKGTACVAGAMVGLVSLPLALPAGLYTGLKDLSLFAQKVHQRNKAYAEAEEIFDADLLHKDYS